jgi:hypothetical protein
MKLKRLLLASALALSFVVSTPSVAKADPISAAIVTFIGFTGTAATVATFVINSALYAAGSWAVGKAAQALGLVKSAVAERQASVTTLSLGETPRELIVGQACTGGTLIDAFNFGGKYGTDTVTRCIGLADHELASIVGYYVDDQYYPWVAGGVQPGFNGKLSIDFRNAADVGWAPPLHVIQSGGWAVTDRLCSIAHVWIDTRVDDQVWSQGHPRFRFVVNGLKAYDPRKDAALGYTGPNPHVWENVMTHEFTRNAEVLRYNFQRGIYATGKHGQAEHLLLGRGLTIEEAPPHRVIAAANLCDEIVDGERRYTANGVISASQAFIDVEEMFAAAMAGVIVQRDGGVEVEPGQAKAAFPTITDADLAAGEPVSFTEFQPDTDGGRINTVVPRYVEPAQGYKDHGGPREMTLPLMLVTSGGQADRCAEIARRRARLERRASIVLPPDYAEIEEGDWIAWRSDRYHDGGTVRYQVTSYSLDEKWRQHISLEEIASSVYGAPDPIEDRADPPPPPSPIDALVLNGVSAEAVTLAGETSTLPAIRFRWDVAVSDTAMTAVRAEVRRAGETEIATTRSEDVDAGAMIVTNGVWPDAELEARLVPIGDPSRPVMPSAWFTVTTTAVTADISDETRDQIVEDVLGQVGDAFEDTETSRKAAEVLLESILNEQQSLEAEARDRLEADTGVLQEARVYTDDVKSWADLTFYTRATTDAGFASTLQYARAYSDGQYQQAELLFSTKAERASGDATAVLQAKAYTDDFKSQASFIYATQVAMGAANAATLSAAQSYTNGHVATALNMVYTKAQTDSGLATTLQEAKAHADANKQEASLLFSTKVERENGDAATYASMKSYIDAYKAEANLTFAAQSSLNGVSATAALALQTAQTADGKLNEARIRILAAAEGGQPAFAEFYSGSGAASSIMLRAEQIGFFTGGTGKALVTFQGNDVVINGNLVVTSSIQAGAVTSGASSRSVGDVGIGLAPTEVQSCSINTVGGRVRVDLSTMLYGASTSPSDVIATVTRNGAQVFSGVIGRMNGIQRLYVGGDTGPTVDGYVDIPGMINAAGTLFFIDEFAPAGTLTYRLSLSCGTAVVASERNIALLELKR